MKFIKLEDYVVSAGAAAFIICGSLASLPNQANFEPKYRSHLEVPHHQDLPGHIYIYEHPSTITMVASGSSVPFWNQDYGLSSIVQTGAVKVIGIED
jgi:hypothetical protein